MKKKIAILHYSYPPVIGGVEFIIKGHASVLAQHGHKVKILAGVGESNEKNIQICLLKGATAAEPETKLVQDELSRGIVSRRFEELKCQLMREIKKALSGVQVCFIHNVLTMHFNLALSAALVDLIPTLSSKIRFYAWCHDASILNPDYRLPHIDRYPWRVINEMHKGIRYIAISKLRQRELSRLFKTRPSSIRIVPDGMDVKSFLGIKDRIWKLAFDLDLFNQDLVIFFPSRILRRKNYELAIRTVKALRRWHKKIILLLTGAPDPHNPTTVLYWKELRRLINKLGVRDNVVFLHDLKGRHGEGFRVGYAELQNLYDLSDLLFITSVQEGFGLPLLEAASKKLPIACSDIPPFREVASGKALFFKLGDRPEVIAKRIYHFIGKQASHKMFRSVLSTYSWEAIYKHCLERLVS